MEPLSDPHVETLWTPGMPLPEAPTASAWQQAPQAKPLPQKAATRTCFTCFFEGPSDAYGRATLCPMRDSPWN